MKYPFSKVEEPVRETESPIGQAVISKRPEIWWLNPFRGKNPFTSVSVSQVLFIYNAGLVGALPVDGTFMEQMPDFTPDENSLGWVPHLGGMICGVGVAIRPTLVIGRGFGFELLRNGQITNLRTHVTYQHNKDEGIQFSAIRSHIPKYRGDEDFESNSEVVNFEAGERITVVFRQPTIPNYTLPIDTDPGDLVDTLRIMMWLYVIFNPVTSSQFLNEVARTIL